MATADKLHPKGKGVVYLYQDNPTGKRRGKAPKTDWQPADAMKNAANRLLRQWNGARDMGATDVLHWELADGTPAFAFRGPALRIESNSLGQDKYPVNNRGHHADVTLQKALGLDTKLAYQGYHPIGIDGGAGQTMSEGAVGVCDHDWAPMPLGAPARLRGETHYCRKCQEGR